MALDDALKPAARVTLPTSASRPPPKFRYALRNMPRSPSVSSAAEVPSCGTQAPPPQITEKAAGVSVPPSVNDELAGVAKSTWKRNSGHVAPTSSVRNGFGAPAGGGLLPSRSAGMNGSLPLLNQDGSRNVTKAGFGLPASMAARSNAKGCGPRKFFPPESKTFID